MANNSDNISLFDSIHTSRDRSNLIFDLSLIHVTNQLSCKFLPLAIGTEYGLPYLFCLFMAHLHSKIKSLKKEPKPCELRHIHLWQWRLDELYEHHLQLCNRSHPCCYDEKYDEINRKPEKQVLVLFETGLSVEMTKEKLLRLPSSNKASSPKCNSTKVVQWLNIGTLAEDRQRERIHHD